MFNCRGFFPHKKQFWNRVGSSLDVWPNVIWVPKQNNHWLKKSSLRHSKLPPHVCSICLGNKTKYCHRRLASRSVSAQAGKDKVSVLVKVTEDMMVSSLSSLEWVGLNIRCTEEMFHYRGASVVSMGQPWTWTFPGQPCSKFNNCYTHTNKIQN